jgi:hypothetical protein
MWKNVVSWDIALNVIKKLYNIALNVIKKLYNIAPNVIKKLYNIAPNVIKKLYNAIVRLALEFAITAPARYVLVYGVTRVKDDTIPLYNAADLIVASSSG